MTLEDPSSFILSRTVLEIEHRVARAGVGVVIRRRIDEASPPLASDLRVIEADAHIAVRHILRQGIAHAILGNLNAARVHAHAKVRMAAGIVHADPIGIERVVVKTFDQWRRRHTPHAIDAARHRELLSGDVHIHRLGCGRFDLEGRAVVGQNARICRTHHIRRRGLGVFDRRGAHSLRRAAPCKICIQSLQSLLVGNGSSMGRSG